jgi:hypothetical protein
MEQAFGAQARFYGKRLQQHEKLIADLAALTTDSDRLARVMQAFNEGWSPFLQTDQQTDVTCEIDATASSETDVTAQAGGSLFGVTLTGGLTKKDTSGSTGSVIIRTVFETRDLSEVAGKVTSALATAISLPAQPPVTATDPKKAPGGGQ